MICGSQLTVLTGIGLAVLIGCGMAGEPASSPAARAIACPMLRWAFSFCPAGMITKPIRAPTATTVATPTAARTLHGRSMAAGSGGVSGTSAMSAQPVHDRLRRRVDEELCDRPPVGEQHQHRDDDVPEAKAVERRRNSVRLVHRTGIFDLSGRSRDAAAVQRGEVRDE